MGQYDSINDYISKYIRYGLDVDQWLAHTTINERNAAILSWQNMMSSIESYSTGYTRTVFVPPSNDWSGDTDTAAIQAAIDSLAYNPNLRRSGIVLLSGDYLINDTLNFGTSLTSPVGLMSMGTSSIRWIAIADYSKYVLKFDAASTSRSRTPIMQDIHVNCDNRCRGVFFNYLPHHSLMRDCYIYLFQQIGVDAIDCWGASITDSTVTSGMGVALRTKEFNNGYIQGCEFQGIGSKSASGANSTLYTYEMENGKDAAETYFGDDYVDNWPAEDDTATLRHSGGYIRTLEDERAGVILHGYGVSFVDSSCEGSKYIEYPNIYLQSEGPSGTSTETGCCVLRNVCMENTTNRNSKVCFQGNEYGGSFRNKSIDICDVVVIEITYGAGCCKTFVELRGSTKWVNVHDCYLTGMDSSLILATDGIHYDPICKRCGVFSNVIDEVDWIASEGSASISYSDELFRAGMFASGGALGIGHPLVPGSYRIIEDNGSLVVQRYEESDGGTGTGTSLDWVTKATLATP